MRPFSTFDLTLGRPLIMSENMDELLFLMTFKQLVDCMDAFTLLAKIIFMI